MIKARRVQAQAHAQAPRTLELVALSDQQMTGVAVAPTSRIFVNVPRWEQDVAISVAVVLKDGSLKPYPDAEWNRYGPVHREAAPGQDRVVPVYAAGSIRSYPHSAQTITPSMIHSGRLRRTAAPSPTTARCASS
jgi:hypothetical protein